MTVGGLLVRLWGVYLYDWGGPTCMTGGGGSTCMTVGGLPV